MPAIVEFPAIVQEAAARFADLLANEPERVHLAEYLTGLLVADRKNICSIHRQFAVTTDQSCLNRFLTEAQWDAQRFNLRRLAWLQESPSTRYHAQGVIALDNVLIDHDGQLIEDVAYYWDHCAARYKIAHDYLIANYVCSSGKHYPLDFRRFANRPTCELKGQAFADHNQLFRELVQWVVDQQIPGDFTFDLWFTHAANLNAIHGLGRGYVGDLKFNRKLRYRGQELKAEALAATIGPELRKKVTWGNRPQWYFTVSLRIPEVDHPVRIVILWAHWNSVSPDKILVTNRTYWEVSRILRVYGGRWKGTECFHRDGKQHLGMGDCQLRTGQGQTRHLYLVFLAHSVLLRQLQQGRAWAWALERLTTIGQACRAVSRETLRTTIRWVIARVQKDGWDDQRITTHLALT